MHKEFGVSTLTRWDMEQSESTRLWLSDQQWLAILARIEREAKDYQGPDRRDGRPRSRRFPAKLRCVIRAQQPDGRSGTYMVCSHNISAGGLGFLHSQPLPRGSRCTVALEKSDGQGLITSGRVAWARQVDDRMPAAFEVGIQFDRPIDPTPFTTDGRAVPA